MTSHDCSATFMWTVVGDEMRFDGNTPYALT